MVALRKEGRARPSLPLRAERRRLPRPVPLAHPVEAAVHAAFLLCGVLTVGVTLLIAVFLLASGAPAVAQIGPRAFLLGARWAPGEGLYGIAPFLLTSVAGTSGAVLLGAPLGVLTALFLAKDASAAVRGPVRAAVDLLAGIPSVVYGLVGMIAVVPAVQRAFGLASGACLLSAILVLAVMLLPYVVSVSETALRAVPREIEEASLALGATEEETWLRVTLPAARSGIAAAVAQGVGRALGEAMAVLMVSGNVANLPGLLRPARFLPAAVASEMSYAAVGSLHRQALFSIGLVLFLFVLLLGALLGLWTRREGER